MSERANANRPLDERLERALNRIKKPSTAEEITDLLNQDLGPEDRPFQSREVAACLRTAERNVLTLYWLKTRPRG